MRSIAISLLICFVFISSCVRIPTDEANCKLYPPSDLEKTTELALDSQAFHEGVFPNECWWEIFEDCQLSALISRGLKENPTLQKVEARVHTAEEEAKIKKSRLYPTIGFSTDIDWQYLGINDFFRAYTPVIPGNVTETEIDLNFYYEFDFWGKNRNIYKAAFGQAKAQIAELASAQLILSTSIATTYYKLQANLQKLQFLEEERKLLTQLFQLTKERVEHALDTAQDLLNAEEKLFVINKNILIAKERVALSKNMLRLLLGEGPDVEEEIKHLSLALQWTFPMPKHLSCNLIARRPDLIARLWLVQAMAHQVGAAKADFYPNVDLYALAGLDSVFFSKLFQWESRKGSMKPAVHLPIFTAGRLKANLRARQGEFDQAIHSYNETIIQAAKEVADGVLILKTADENLKVEEMLVRNRMENRNIENKRYEHAISNLLDLLHMQDLVIQEEFLRIKYQYKKVVAAIQLIKALGGGYCNEENPLE